MTEQNIEQVEAQLDAEIEQVRAALKNANNESASHRHMVKDLQGQVSELSAIAERVKTQFMNSQMNLILERNGITNPKVAKLIDHEGLSIDDNGDLTGAVEQIDKLREEFPELFAVQPKIPSVDAADKVAPKAFKSSAEKLLKSAK
ncbi:phage scaffolding protein [Rhodococcus sp. IEGM 1379]|uniref:phage scaffolding protein n=1 Tax=Rhodococcus sp. IEGM 1379 TaxID=3047086 RepID=UPI0024B72AA8|nr:phage scaffolding protein [Rhodococcus sp. IEGM 1379]MDI9915500.1 phage scaffolding protein [Rhodococcus sp. IEGM 1379]